MKVSPSEASIRSHMCSVLDPDKPKHLQSYRGLFQPEHTNHFAAVARISNLTHMSSRIVSLTLAVGYKPRPQQDIFAFCTFPFCSICGSRESERAETLDLRLFQMSSQGPPWHSRPLGWHLTNDGASCQHSLHQYVTGLSWPISSSTSLPCSSTWHVPVGLILQKIPRQRARKIGDRSFISAWPFLGLQLGVMLVDCSS